MFFREITHMGRGFLITISAGLVFLLAGISFGQTGTVAQNNAGTAVGQKNGPGAMALVFKDYRGVAIGMNSDKVRDVLDKKPKVDDDSGFYYVFSDKESAQIEFDPESNVRLISVTYSSDKAAPTFEDVFGSEVPLTAEADGKIYKRVSYPDAGVWVAYFRGGGKDPSVSVTIQKML